MSTYNPNFVPPAHAPMPLNGNNFVNGVQGSVQQQPGPPPGQQYIPQKQPQQFQQPPPAAAFPGAGAPGNVPPPQQFNSGITNQFLPPTSGAATPVQQLPPSTLPPHLRPPAANGPPLTNGSNGASSANSSRTASPRPVGAAPQYAQGPIAAALNNPPLASGLRPSPQPTHQSLANLTSNLENLNLNTTRANGGTSILPQPQTQQQYPPTVTQKDGRGVASAQTGPPQFNDANSLLAASGVAAALVPNAMATPFSGQKPPNLAPNPAKMFGSASMAGRPTPAGQRIPYGVPPPTNPEQQSQQNNNLQNAPPPPRVGAVWPPSLPNVAAPGAQPMMPPAQQTPQTYPYSQVYQPGPQQQPPPPQSAVQPPPPGMFGTQPTGAPLQYQAQAPPQAYGQHPQQAPQTAPGGPYGTTAPLNVAQQGFSRLWGQDTIDLMQNRHILTPATLPPPKVVLHNQFHESINCSPSIMRCTLTKIPESNSLLQKSRLPLGIVIHPFRDVNVRILLKII